MEWLAKVADNANITASQFKVAFCLINRLSCKTQQCNPSILTIASDAGVQPRAAQKTIKILENEQLLLVHRVRGGDRNLTNSFKFIQNRTTEAFTPVQPCTPVPRDTGVPTSHLPLSPGTPRNNKLETKRKVTKEKIPCRFAEWYEIYPLKKSKANALKSWQKQNLTLRAGELIEILKNQVAHDKNYSGNFIPHPSTYLNGKRWEDEIETCTSRVNGTKTASQTHKDIYQEIAVAGSLDRGNLREDEITLHELMDEEHRRRQSRH